MDGRGGCGRLSTCGRSVTSGRPRRRSLETTPRSSSPPVGVTRPSRARSQPDRADQRLLGRAVPRRAASRRDDVSGSPGFAEASRTTRSRRCAPRRTISSTGRGAESQRGKERHEPTDPMLPSPRAHPETDCATRSSRHRRPRPRPRRPRRHRRQDPPRRRYTGGARSRRRRAPDSIPVLAFTGSKAARPVSLLPLGVALVVSGTGLVPRRPPPPALVRGRHGGRPDALSRSCGSSSRRSGPNMPSRLDGRPRGRALFGPMRSFEDDSHAQHRSRPRAVSSVMRAVRFSGAHLRLAPQRRSSGWRSGRPRVGVSSARLVSDALFRLSATEVIVGFVRCGQRRASCGSPSSRLRSRSASRRRYQPKRAREGGTRQRSAGPPESGKLVMRSRRRAAR